MKCTATRSHEVPLQLIDKRQETFSDFSEAPGKLTKNTSSWHSDW